MRISFRTLAEINHYDVLHGTLKEVVYVTEEIASEAVVHCCSPRSPVLSGAACSHQLYEAAELNFFELQLKGSTILKFPKRVGPSANVMDPIEVPIVDKEGEIDDLIAQLCMDAPSDPIKFCLRLYQHGKSLAQLEKDFEREKKPTLVATAEYLKIANCEAKIKKPLAHLIICRIQNLLPENCTQCNERYRIDPCETPILECSICGQGVHKKCWMHLASIMSNVDDLSVGEPLSDIDNVSFKKLYNPLNLPGIYYICDICKDTTIPNDEDGNSKRLKAKGNINEIPEASHTQSSTDNNTSHNHIIESQSISLHDSQSQSEVSPDESEITIPILSSSESEKSQIICRFFTKGKCKHGMKGIGCNFTHPNICSKYTHHGTRQPRGCNLGKKCNDFHPVMCINSLRKGECFSESCKFNHIKGTKRHPPPTQNQNINSKPTPTQPQNHPPLNESVSSNQLNAHDNHFLEVIRLLKAEILETMEQKMTSITNQIQQIHQNQNQQPYSNTPVHPANLMGAIRQPLLQAPHFNPPAHLANQQAPNHTSLIRHAQFSVPPQMYFTNQSYPPPPRLPMQIQNQSATSHS